MKRLITLMSMAALLWACGGSDQGGTVNDGAKDTSTLNTETMNANDPITDTSKGEDRVDTWKRDTNVADTTK